MANVEKLMQLRDLIIEFKENFDYSGVFGNKNGKSSKLPLNSLLQHNCQTCGCILGFWGAVNDLKEDSPYIIDHAQVDLGLTDRERRFLFFGCPLGPFGEFDYTTATSADYQEAVDRIQYLIVIYKK